MDIGCVITATEWIYRKEIDVMTVDVRTIKVGDVFQKWIKLADGTVDEDGIIECIGFEKNSIILKYSYGRHGDFVERISKNKAQRVVFGNFLGANRI